MSGEHTRIIYEYEVSTSCNSYLVGISFLWKIVNYDVGVGDDPILWDTFNTSHHDPEIRRCLCQECLFCHHLVRGYQALHQNVLYLEIVSLVMGCTAGFITWSRGMLNGEICAGKFGRAEAESWRHGREFTMDKMIECIRRDDMRAIEVYW